MACGGVDWIRVPEDWGGFIVALLALRFLQGRGNTIIIEERETNSKIQNIRDLYMGISDFKKGYQPRSNIVKDEKGDLVADSHSIVGRWRNYFSHLFNVHEFTKYTQQNQSYLSQVPLRLSWLSRS